MMLSRKIVNTHEESPLGAVGHLYGNNTGQLKIQVDRLGGCCIGAEPSRYG